MCSCACCGRRRVHRCRGRFAGAWWWPRRSPSRSRLSPFTSPSRSGPSSCTSSSRCSRSTWSCSRWGSRLAGAPGSRRSRPRCAGAADWPRRSRRSASPWCSGRAASSGAVRPRTGSRAGSTGRPPRAPCWRACSRPAHRSGWSRTSATTSSGTPGRSSGACHRRPTARSSSIRRCSSGSRSRCVRCPARRSCASCWCSRRGSPRRSAWRG